MGNLGRPLQTFLHFPSLRSRRHPNQPRSWWCSPNRATVQVVRVRHTRHLHDLSMLLFYQARMFDGRRRTRNNNIDCRDSMCGHRNIPHCQNLGGHRRVRSREDTKMGCRRIDCWRESTRKCTNRGSSTCHHCHYWRTR